MVGNNETLSSVFKGHYKGPVLQQDGTSVEITLQDVLYIPNLIVNLFSLSKAIETRLAALSSTGQINSLTFGTAKIFLAKSSNMVQDVPLGLKYIPHAATAQTLDINVVGEIFGHPILQVLAATAAKFAFKTKNALQVCSNCALSKAKQKILDKLIAHPSMELGGRMNINISSVQNKSYG
jgi:hypothetical protein